MLNNWYRISVTFFVTIIAVLFALPNFIRITSDILPSNSVNLGLDLRGGSHLLLNVDFKTYLEYQYDVLSDSLRQEFRHSKMGYKNLSHTKDYIVFDLRKSSDYEDVQKILRSINNDLWTERDGDRLFVRYSADALSKMKDEVIDQSIEVIRLRIDSNGTKEPVIQKYADSGILLEVPGADNPQEIKTLIGKTARLSFHLVNEEANLVAATKGSVPSDSVLMFIEHDGNQYPCVIKKKSYLTGDMLNNASVTFNEYSQPAVSFSFNATGAKIFADLTKQNRGKRIAIVLDEKVLSAPVVNDPILGGSGVISGSMDLDAANELALLLRAGALPAPLKIIEERTIGPSLGLDSINSGIKAGVIGFCAVVIFMILSYGILGVIANIALSLSLLYILAMLSMFGATLTLPGIAGIILTIGMAVDANILIYERIREEVKRNVPNILAIKRGFDSAFGTIVDANITTFIVALLLYIFGAGVIKGFAVTLTIGLIASMFTATVVTKLMIDLWFRVSKPERLIL